MKLRYPGGQLMPENVIEALCYMGKVGVMSRETWYHHFARGVTRWKQRQLTNLYRSGVIKPHSCGRGKESWVLSESSARLLRFHNLSSVSPVLPQHIVHDELVATSMLQLQKKNVTTSWLTERELKSRNSMEFIVSKKNCDAKYPDAIFQVRFGDQLRMFALEYERTGKSSLRYRSILRQYANLRSLSMILYVVEEEAVKKRIESALKFVGDMSTSEKVAFTSAKEWRENPLTSQLQLRAKVLTFEDISRIKNV